ncbi:MAG TPA: protein kinase [Anaerolineales bacterium]|nr:protein kinase [Anaerolineales bacterium]
MDTMILGRYEIRRQVRGNDLFVEYWGQDVQTGRDVTVAVVQARLGSPAEFLTRLTQLSKKLEYLKSANFAQWIATGEANGQAVIVREYVDGTSLSEMLSATGSGLTLDVVLNLARQLGNYLDMVHHAGLTQLVFRPEDIMFSTENSVVVTNIGIAQSLNVAGLISAQKISPHSSYAPELVSGGPVDIRSDFYSLGAILFQALTGKEWAAPLASADKTLPAEYNPSGSRAGISSGWDALISKCLHPNPAKRIQSAVEFLHHVEEIHQETLVPDQLLGMEDSLVGQTLGGYHLVSRLGQGGMATVYKAYEPALDRYVAIKVLPQFFAKDPVFVQRFKREAKAVAQLSHPHIVPIYSFGEAGRITYIAMQFVMGDTLKHEGQQLGFEESLRLLAPIARALGYAHQRGIVHRDIKPSNILLTEGNWPLLADFGLAQMTQASGKLTESGVGMGTPMYMSPEQGQGAKVDHRTDIYSLGIVLYEMITGDVPFRADTPMAIVIKHISAPMPTPRQVNPDIPEYLEAIILRATAKSPEDRFQTAEDFAEAMEKALERLASDVSLRGQGKPPVVQRPAQPEHRPEVQKEAPAPTRRFAWAALPILGIISLACLGVLFLGISKICPASDSTWMPPWCAVPSATPPEVSVEPTLTSKPLVSTDVPVPDVSVPAGMMLDDFDSPISTERTPWKGYFEENKDTRLDCHMDGSHEFGDSNYLNLEFDLDVSAWGACGYYFDIIQDWSGGDGITFYLRSDQPNTGYHLEILGGTPNARTTYVYWTEAPPESAEDWVRIDIPWRQFSRADWEEDPGTALDPSTVTGFIIVVTSSESSRLQGTLWMDDLALLAAP